MRGPYADGPLAALPAEAAGDDRLLTALLALSDVRATGHHAALAAGVRPGATVAVVGDGAVGLCGVLAARRLGADQIVALGRHAARTDIARTFGATDVVPERGDAAIAAVRELSKGQGAPAGLEGGGCPPPRGTATRRSDRRHRDRRGGRGSGQLRHAPAGLAC